MDQEDQINLWLCGSNIFIWKADDWLRLRRDYRIVGECVGCLVKHPRQNSMSGLPMMLMPEEAKLLIDKKVGRLVENSSLKESPTESLTKTFESYRDKLYQEQQQCLIDQRKVQISNMMDTIIEGKKRKILGIQTAKKKHWKKVDDETKRAMDSIEIDKDELMEEELAKLPPLDQNEALVQTHTAYPMPDNNIVEIKNWLYPSSKEECFKYKVYKDLWEQKYFVTGGMKFGCDFLVYPGDPIIYHSQLIVHCQDRDEEIPVLEIIAKCRMSTNVRKTLVFATLSEDDNDIEYTSSKWYYSSMNDT